MVIKRYKNNINVSKDNRVKGIIENNNRHGGVSMNKTTAIYKPLDEKKKNILKSLAGSASTKIDLNKVRDEWKYGNN